MRTYFTTGTAGDAYIILCKLYRIAIKEEILCKHFVKYKETKFLIKEIFSLLPNIQVEFINNFGGPFKYIRGSFYYAGRSDNQEEAEFYPTFESNNLNYFNLPETYKIIQFESGFRQDRRLRIEVAKKITKDSKLPVVILGKDSLPFSSTNCKIIDLRNKTTIKELINIIKNSQHFYGPQGLLSFIALSQKVHSTIYLRNGGDKKAIFGRIEIIPEWNKYFIKGMTW